MKKRLSFFAALMLLFSLAICLVACSSNVNTYTVKFITDDGTQIGVTQSVKDGEELTVETPPEKDGYEFVCWLLGGEAYDFEADGAKKVTKDMTFVASYTEAKLTVSFYDGEELVETKKVKKGSRVTPIAFEKEGYVFNFWAAEGETASFNFNAVIQSDVKLIANLTVKQYTVKFYDSDGITPLGGENAEQSLDFGTEFIVPVAPDRSDEHKIFLGWRIEGTDTVTDLSAAGANVVSAADVTYVAEYALEKYRVTFYDEDGETVLYTVEAEYGTYPEYKGEPPTKTESGKVWVFARWNKTLQVVTEDTSYIAEYKEYSVVQEENGDSYDSDFEQW